MGVGPRDPIFKRNILSPAHDAEKYAECSNEIRIWEFKKTTEMWLSKFIHAVPLCQWRTSTLSIVTGIRAQYAAIARTSIWDSGCRCVFSRQCATGSKSFSIRHKRQKLSFSTKKLCSYFVDGIRLRNSTVKSVSLNSIKNDGDVDFTFCPLHESHEVLVPVDCSSDNAADACYGRRVTCL